MLQSASLAPRGWRQGDPCGVGARCVASASAPLPLRALPRSSGGIAQQRRRRGALVCVASSPQQQGDVSSKRGKLPPGLFTAPVKQSGGGGSSGSGGRPGGDDDLDTRWRFFDPKAYDRPWPVPWGAGATAGVMAAWVFTFAGTAFFAAPASYIALHGGAPLSELGPAGQADFALWSEILELAVTGALLYAVVARAPGGAEAAARARLFDYSPAAPFRRADGWLAWGLFGTCLAPLAVGAAALLLSATGYENVVAGGRGTADGVAGMLTLELPTYLRLVAVTGVLAPLLEETLFRGFLLTSLTKFMPVPAAIFASSLAFGVAHLSLKDLPVLTTLGCLLGLVYTRSRNLLAPMMVHGLWNSTVLTLLFALTAAGVDVQQLLREGGL